MILNFKNALKYGFVLYVATFVVGFAVGLASRSNISSLVNLGEIMWYVGMLASVLLTIVCTNWYLNTKAVRSSFASGIIFGFIAVALSITIDIILFSFGNLQGAHVDLFAYYSDPRFWITALLVIISAGVTGYIKRRR